MRTGRRNFNNLICDSCDSMGPLIECNGPLVAYLEEIYRTIGWKVITDENICLCPNCRHVATKDYKEGVIPKHPLVDPEPLIKWAKAIEEIKKVTKDSKED